MLRIHFIFLYILSFSTQYCNPIASIHLNHVIQSSAVFDGFDTTCQRISKTKKTPSKVIEHCALKVRSLKKNLQKIQFQSNHTIRTILKDRHTLYTTQHKYENISSELQKLSDRYQIASSNTYDQMANEIVDFHNHVDQNILQSYFSKTQTELLLSQRYNKILQAVDHFNVKDDFQILINNSKDKLDDVFTTFLDNYEMPSGKNLFNYILRSPNPKPMILLASLLKTRPRVYSPKIYNKIPDTTKKIEDEIVKSSNSGPKKVTVSSWRNPQSSLKVAALKKTKKKKSLSDEFSSIFSTQSEQMQELLEPKQDKFNPSEYGVVQLPILLALHPEMQKFDPNTKRFISANPQNFVKDGFFQGFRKKFLRSNVNNDSFQQLSQLQALESSRLLDIVNSEKQQKSIYRNIQQTVSRLVKKHQLKGVFYDNLRSSQVSTMFLQNKVIVNNNVNDLTKETLTSLYANSDRQVLEKVINSLRKAQLIN